MAWAQRGGGPLNPQALNRYSYVLNNPVNATDPTGHANCAASDGGAGPCMLGGGGEGGGSGGGTKVGRSGRGSASEPPPLRSGPDMRGQTMESDGSIHPTEAGEAEAGQGQGKVGYAPDRPLPRTKDGVPVPDTDAPHATRSSHE